MTFSCLQCRCFKAKVAEWNRSWLSDWWRTRRKSSEGGYKRRRGHCSGADAKIVATRAFNVLYWCLQVLRWMPLAIIWTDLCCAQFLSSFSLCKVTNGINSALCSQRRLLIGVGASLAIGALALIPSDVLEFRPRQPLQSFLVPILRSQVCETCFAWIKLIEGCWVTIVVVVALCW